MWDKHADGAGVNRTAKSAQEIVERDLQRPPDAQLRHNESR
jgi:hypothetical protein